MAKPSRTTSRKGFMIVWDWSQTTPKLETKTTPTQMAMLLQDLLKAAASIYPTRNGIPEWVPDWSFRIHVRSSQVLLAVEEKEEDSSHGKNAQGTAVPPKAEGTH